MRQRNSYPNPFKAQVVREYLQPSATSSSVVIRHGITPTLFVSGYRLRGAATLSLAGVCSGESRTEKTICVGDHELSFGEHTLMVKWRSSDTESYSRFVRGFAP